MLFPHHKTPKSNVLTPTTSTRTLTQHHMQIPQIGLLKSRNTLHPTPHLLPPQPRKQKQTNTNQLVIRTNSLTLHPRQTSKPNQTNRKLIFLNVAKHFNTTLRFRKFNAKSKSNCTCSSPVIALCTSSYFSFSRPAQVIGSTLCGHHAWRFE